MWRVPAFPCAVSHRTYYSNWSRLTERLVKRQTKKKNMLALLLFENPVLDQRSDKDDKMIRGLVAWNIA